MQVLLPWLRLARSRRQGNRSWSVFVSDVFWVLSHVQVADVVDILLVAVLFYALFFLAQGTQAVQLLRGMVMVILAAFLASQILPFKGFSWLIRTALPALLIAIPVVFQPELRRALERLGRTGSLLARYQQDEVVEQMVDEVARAAHRLANQRHGALIVFERETGLHDKAVIIRHGKIVAASCMLPVTHNPQYSGMGTRHRAAIGLTEESDALVISVSEETGIISVAHNGRIIRRLDINRLRNVLLAFFQHRLGGRGWTKRV
jgi:diadenylate cyclase